MEAEIGSLEDDWILHNPLFLRPFRTMYMFFNEETDRQAVQLCGKLPLWNTRVKKNKYFCCDHGVQSDRPSMGNGAASLKSACKRWVSTKLDEELQPKLVQTPRTLRRNVAGDRRSRPEGQHVGLFMSDGTNCQKNHGRTLRCFRVVAHGHATSGPMTWTGPPTFMASGANEVGYSARGSDFKPKSRLSDPSPRQPSLSSAMSEREYIAGAFFFSICVNN